MLVRKTRSTDGIDLLSVDLDVDAWTLLLKDLSPALGIQAAIYAMRV